MNEKSWWSNNILAVTIAVLAFVGITTAGIVGYKMAAEGFSEQIKNFSKIKSSDVRTETKVDHGKNAETGALPSPPDPTVSGPYGSYMQRLQHQIKANWHPPKGNETRRVTVFFKIDRQGCLSNLRVNPSGDTSSDRAAREAVESAAPFAPLPEGCKEKDVDIQFTFDYNVFDRANHRVNSRR